MLSVKEKTYVVTVEGKRYGDRFNTGDPTETAEMEIRATSMEDAIARANMLIDKLKANKDCGDLKIIGCQDISVGWLNELIEEVLYLEAFKK